MNKKNTIFISILFVTTILLTNSCTKDSAEPVNSTPPPAPTPQQTDPCDTVTYTKVIRPIFESKCLSCHGDVNPFAGFSLNSYELLKAKGVSGKLEARVIKGQPSFMPMGSILPQEQRDLFACWIKNGFKQ